MERAMETAGKDHYLGAPTIGEHTPAHPNHDRGIYSTQ